jgi:hypothetical protein
MYVAGNIGQVSISFNNSKNNSLNKSNLNLTPFPIIVNIGPRLKIANYNNSANHSYNYNNPNSNFNGSYNEGNSSNNNDCNDYSNYSNYNNYNNSVIDNGSDNLSENFDSIIAIRIVIIVITLILL